MLKKRKAFLDISNYLFIFLHKMLFFDLKKKIQPFDKKNNSVWKLPRHYGIQN
jgi:hypothetical protein